MNRHCKVVLLLLFCTSLWTSMKAGVTSPPSVQKEHRLLQFILKEHAPLIDTLTLIAKGQKLVSEEEQVPEIIRNIISDGRKYLGKPYKCRGIAKWPLDCSGFLYFIYGNQGISLARTSYAMHSECKKVEKPRVGDLIFFKGTPRHRPNGVGHVAMIVEIKDGIIYMMHSSSRGIVWENFTGRKNYEKRFVSFGRITALNNHWQNAL
ncbi:C40 family peptidase [Porphyromonas gingivicanis]|uniref:C40 family peptidase n=1 Tax=Porphyromonas gingivicanis TaxID=266762 RepID=UPI0004717B38|nr:NlpC/P60 family protein [Porphyromonas gingivicanis]